MPGEGAFCRCEGGLRSGAPPPPTARPLGGLSGSAILVLWARVCGCGGPALSPWLACPVGAACRGGGGGPSPGGVACHRCEGRLLSGAVPPPAARPLGRAAGTPRPVRPGCGRCGRGDSAPAPQRAPLRSGVARCGGGGRASPGGGAFHRCEGGLRSGAPPPPTARPPAGLSGSATHVLWARVCGCGGPALSPWPACPVEAACRRGGGGPSPGGVACHRCEGRLVSGAVPPPAAHPLGQAAGVPRPVCPGCGRCGRGDPAPAPQRVPLRAGVARCWGGGRASPRRAAVHRCEGRLGSGAPPPPAARPLGGLSGSAIHVLWARVCGRGGPAPAPWLACPVGGCAPWGWWGASGFTHPLFPAARPLGGLPGPAGHVLWASVWVCAVCVVSVQCVSCRVVSPFACPSGAPLSGASVRCCARRVPAVPPSLHASLARLLGTPCFLRGFVALYPFPCPLLARPSPWHALFSCLQSGVCLCLFPCRLVFLSHCAL